MKSSQYTNSQIIKILEAAQGGMPVPELCREHGMSRAIVVQVARKVWRHGRTDDGADERT